MPSTFQPPVAYTGPRVLPSTRGPARSFFGRAGPAPVGQTVLKTAGVYTTVQTPTVAQCAAADIVYLGGHIYTVSDDEAAALTAAGYGAGLS